MIKNEINVSRESSKEKVDRIHRLRVEIEKIREENSFLLNKLDKYDDWLFESVDEINKLLDKNISDDSYDYEEESNEYDFDPNDLNFGEKKRSKPQLQKKYKKDNIENGENEINSNNMQNINEHYSISSAQEKVKTGRSKKEITENPQSSKEKNEKQIIKTDESKKTKLNNPQIPTSRFSSSAQTGNSSSFETLYRLNPQLAAQILRPFIEEYKKRLLQNSINKTDNKNNAQTNTETNLETISQLSVVESISSKNEEAVDLNETENQENSNEENLQGDENKDEDPFDDL